MKRMILWALALMLLVTAFPVRAEAAGGSVLPTAPMLALEAEPYAPADWAIGLERQGFSLSLGMDRQAVEAALGPGVRRLDDDLLPNYAFCLARSCAVYKYTEDEPFALAVYYDEHEQVCQLDFEAKSGAPYSLPCGLRFGDDVHAIYRHIGENLMIVPEASTPLFNENPMIVPAYNRPNSGLFYLAPEGGQWRPVSPDYVWAHVGREFSKRLYSTDFQSVALEGDNGRLCSISISYLDFMTIDQPQHKVFLPQRNSDIVGWYPTLGVDLLDSDHAINLGMTRAQVELLLGPPQDTSDSRGDVRAHYPGSVDVTYNDKDAVRTIALPYSADWALANLLLPGGLRMGDPLEKAQHTFGSYLTRDDYMNPYADEGTECYRVHFEKRKMGWSLLPLDVFSARHWVYSAEDYAFMSLVFYDDQLISYRIITMPN